MGPGLRRDDNVFLLRDLRVSVVKNGVNDLADLDIRQKAERIAALWRERRQTDILPAELMPADLDES